MISVSRAYGGNLTAAEARDRIMRAFFIEECKNYKKKHASGSADKKDKRKKKVNMSNK